MTQILVRHKVDNLDSLPMLPTVAQQILSLSGNPDSMPKDLAAIVKIDPSLSAQIIRQANSAFYGFRGKVDSVEMAIIQVLGYDWTLSLALVISTLNVLELPSKGPLGILAFWKRAVSCALVTEKLARSCPADKNVSPALSYLSGLIHDIGYLILCHICPREYRTLNEAIEKQQNESALSVERSMLDMDHLEIGGLVLEHWSMPGPIVVAAREHSQLGYTGPHQEYAKIVSLAHLLLENMDSTSLSEIALPDEIINALQISKSSIETVFFDLVEKQGELDDLAHQLATNSITRH